MAAKSKPTVAKLKQMVEELLTIQAVAERYAALEKQVKADMVALKWKEVDAPGKGRVFISESTRVTIPPALAENKLGADLASKIIQVKRSVSNKLFDAFFQAGEISQAQKDEIERQAERTPVVSLYVRPLK
jgi:hypothetical protein